MFFLTNNLSVSEMELNLKTKREKQFPWVYECKKGARKNRTPSCIVQYNNINLQITGKNKYLL